MLGQRASRRKIVSAAALAAAPLVTLFLTPQVSGNVSTGSGAMQWNNTARWVEGAFPDGIGAVADFSQFDITANTNVTVTDAAGDNTIIAGTLLVGDTSGNNAYTFTLGASQTFIFQVASGSVLIERPNVAGTNNTNFNASFQLGSDLRIFNNSPAGQQLLINGNIGEIGGSRGIELSSTIGSGLLYLQGNNTYSGGTTVSGGAVRISISSQLDLDGNIVSGAFGRGTLTFKGGAVMSNASIANNGHRTIANQLVFDGGRTTLGATTGGVGGVITFTGNATLAQDSTIVNGGSNVGFVNFLGTISQSGGARSLTFAQPNSGGGGGFTLNAANLYTGKTFLEAGNGLVLNNANAIALSTVELVNGTNVGPKWTTAAGPTFTVGGLSGGSYSTSVSANPLTSAIGLRDLGGNAITLRIGNDNANRTFNGVIGELTVDAGTGIMSNLPSVGNLVKTGTGTQTLNAAFTTLGTLLANSYNGTTAVEQGKLVINAYHSSTAGVTVNSGATLGGGGTIASAATIDGTLAPGASTGLLTLQSNVTMGSSSTTQIELGGTTRGASTSGYDAANVGGTLLLNGTIMVSFVDGFDPEIGAVFDLFDWGTVDASNFVVATDLVLPTLSSGLPWDTTMFLSDGIVVAPEPGSMALLAATGMALLRRRRSRQRGA